jgi:hypothetical protein
MWPLIPLLLACGGKVEDSAPPPDTGTIPAIFPEWTTLGDPMWEVSSMVLFQGPTSLDTATCLYEGNHRIDGGNWLPGEAHEGPYANELTGAMDRCGFVAVGDSVFTAAEYTDGNGVWLAMMLEPKSGNVQGSSPDFGIGDIIFDDRFPLIYDVDVRRNEIIVDLDHDGSYPSTYDLGYFVNGHSHMPLVMGTSLEAMPAGATPPGDYTWNVVLRDATSANQGDQGYDIVIPYEVTE